MLGLDRKRLRLWRWQSQSAFEDMAYERIDILPGLLR
jgi:hypothetical protein